MITKTITDKNTWENFLQQHCPEALFQSWSWGEFEESCGQPSRRLGFFHGQRLLAIAQVKFVQARRGNYLHLRHGPILRQWRPEYFTAILAALKKIAQENRAAFIRISPAQTAAILPLLQNAGFRPAPIHNMDAEQTLVVNLKRSEEEILGAMRKTTRNLIRKAAKIGVRVVESDSQKDFADFYWLFKKTAARSGFISERSLPQEFAVFRKDRQAAVFLAYFQKKLIAAALIIFSGNQGIYHYAATDKTWQHIPAAYLLQWAAILAAKKRGLAKYNLWGGLADQADRRHPWWGLSLFKRGFGGEEVNFVHAQDLPLNFHYWKTAAIETIIKYVRGYAAFGPLRAPAALRRLVGV